MKRIIKTKKATSLLLSSALVSGLLAGQSVRAQSSVDAQPETAVEPTPTPTMQAPEVTEPTTTPAVASAPAEVAGNSESVFTKAHIRDLYHSVSNRAAELKMSVADYLKSEQYKNDYSRFTEKVNGKVAEVIQLAAEKGVPVDEIVAAIESGEQKAAALGMSLSDYVTSGKYKEDAISAKNKANQFLEIVVQKANESRKTTPEQLSNILKMIKEKSTALGLSAKDYVTNGNLKADLNTIGNKASELGSKIAQEAEKRGLTKEALTNELVRAAEVASAKSKSLIESLKRKVKEMREKSQAPTEPEVAE